MSRRGSVVAAIAAGVALIAVACGGGDDAAEDVVQTTPQPATTATVAPAQTEAAVTPTPTQAASSDPLEPPFTDTEARVANALRFSFPLIVPERRTVDLAELAQGAPPDGIPAIDNPKFASFEEVREWLDDQEPVVSLEVNGDARAYPLQILLWHEIVNDTVGETPVLVTFCPLCNTALSFDRRVGGEERVFGVSGFLRRSDLIMFDRQTETLWQQIGGDAIVGVDASKRLDFLPSPIVSFADFRETYPEGVVMTRNTGFGSRYANLYGENPYTGYDRIGSRTIFGVSEFDDSRLDAKERVLTVEVDGDAIAFPFSVLSEQVVIEADVGGQPVVAFWQPGALSALDATFIIGSANVGAAAAYAPLPDGEQLTFEARDGKIVDTQSGSTWNVLGLATDGPMAGRSLEPIVSANHFWFAWSVFQPDTRVVGLGAAP